MTALLRRYQHRPRHRTPVVSAPAPIDPTVERRADYGLAA